MPSTPHWLPLPPGWNSNRVKRSSKRCAQAERELASLKESAGERVEVQTIVCEGTPFVEILRKAEDFEVDAIMMGRFGSHGPIEKLLFGTTAEHVMRGSLRTVIVIPVEI